MARGGKGPPDSRRHGHDCYLEDQRNRAHRICLSLWRCGVTSPTCPSPGFPNNPARRFSARCKLGNSAQANHTRATPSPVPTHALARDTGERSPGFSFLLVEGLVVARNICCSCRSQNVSPKPVVDSVRLISINTADKAGGCAACRCSRSRDRDCGLWSSPQKARPWSFTVV